MSYFLNKICAQFRGCLSLVFFISICYTSLAGFQTIDYPGSIWTEINSIDGNVVLGNFQDNLGVHGFLYNGTNFSKIDYPYSKNPNDLVGSARFTCIESGKIIGYYYTYGNGMGIYPGYRSFIANSSSYQTNSIYYTPFATPLAFNNSDTIAQVIYQNKIYGYTKNYSFENVKFVYDPSNSGNAFSYGQGESNVSTIYPIDLKTSPVIQYPQNISVVECDVSSNRVVGYYLDGLNQRHGFIALIPVNPNLGPFVIPPKTFGATPFAITPPNSTSSGAWSFTSGNPSVATIVANTITIRGAGSAVITATQAAKGNFGTASTNAVLTVSAMAPTLGAFVMPTKTYGATPFAVIPPKSNSAGAWSYSSANSNVATISGNTATITGAGTALITATQAASGNYAAATRTAILTVRAATPPLSGFVVPSKVYGDPTFTLSAPTTPSGGTFSYRSSNVKVATVSGNTLTIKGAGSSVITAIQAAGGNYTTNSISATLTVAKADQTITFMPQETNTFSLNGLIPLNGSTTSSLPITYTSGNTKILTISRSGGVMKGRGTTTITATQPGNANFRPAVRVTRTVTLQ